MVFSKRKNYVSFGNGPSKLMDSLQLDSICGVLLKNAFVRVFAENEWKSLRHFERPCGLFVNTEPTPDPGLHWTAIYLHLDNTGEFFDSFDLEPDEPVKRFPGIHAPRGYTCNTKPVQTLDYNVRWILHHLPRRTP